MLRKTTTYLLYHIFSSYLINHFKGLKKRDILSIDKNHNYQVKKLKHVLSIAINHIPFYENVKLNLNDLSYNEFQKLPLLTKDIIRDNSEQLLNNNFPKKNEIYKNSSGGSTGEPVVFYQTKEKGYIGGANYYYALHLNGVNIYDNSVDLWGAERDMYKTNGRFNLKRFAKNNTKLNTFVLSDKIIEEYIQRLNSIKPKFIKAYVHSVYDMAKYINSNNIKIDFQPVIHCTTGPLYLEMRNEISKAFNNAYVYNFYGSREVSAIASEIKNRKGLYVMYDNVFVEILDEYDKPVKKGEEGEIVVTTLNNDYMPLIRYKIGDRAVKGDQLEFGALILDNVVGRTLGVIHKANGSKIDGQFFTSLFFNKQGIKSFQLIQEDITHLTLKIIKNKNFEEHELNQVIKRIKKELGNVVINTQYVNKVDLTSTGKIMYVYSKVDA